MGLFVKKVLTRRGRWNKDRLPRQIAIIMTATSLGEEARFLALRHKVGAETFRKIAL